MRHGYPALLSALIILTGACSRGASTDAESAARAEIDALRTRYEQAIAAGEDYDMFRRLSRVGAIRFLRDVYVHESPRRYRKYGYLYVTLSWFLNFLSVFFLGRSILDQWKPVR